MRQEDVAAFMQTYTGNRFYYPPHLRGNNTISIGDIAHALSNICRFGGHCPTFYSVAQHSVMVSFMVPPEHALAALLHDASEAYLSDVVRPAKRMLPEYKQLEQEIHDQIAEHFGVDLNHPSIKEADNLALYAEAKHFFGDVTDWCLDDFECHVRITPVSPEDAKRMFLMRYEMLTSV